MSFMIDDLKSSELMKYMFVLDKKISNFKYDFTMI